MGKLGLEAVEEFFTDESIRRARLIRITPVLASPIYLTTNSSEIEFEGNSYIVANAVDLSAQSEELSGSAYSIEVSGAIDSDLLTNSDLNNGVYRGAEVVEYIVDPKYPYAGALRTYRYYIQDIKWDGEVFQTTCGGIQDSVKRKKGGIFSRQCVVQLYGEYCGVNKADHRFPSSGEATVDSIQDYRGFSSVGFPVGTNDASQLLFGVIEWVSGDNQGRTSTIIQYSAETFRIAERLPKSIQVGDTFTALKGCQKTIAACNGFNNFANYQGAPYVRGSSASVDAPASS
tara:strand:+ start:18150 stop:19013 length:864 start_codon:yes stop_codon:yes gene_type:complete